VSHEGGVVASSEAPTSKGRIKKKVEKSVVKIEKRERELIRGKVWRR
jgi:hypothetical protein